LNWAILFYELPVSIVGARFFKFVFWLRKVWRSVCLKAMRYGSKFHCQGFVQGATLYLTPCQTLLLFAVVEAAEKWPLKPLTLVSATLHHVYANFPVLAGDCPSHRYKFEGPENPH
jgi:hypothetical protein